MIKTCLGRRVRQIIGQGAAEVLVPQITTPALSLPPLFFLHREILRQTCCTNTRSCVMCLTQAVCVENEGKAALLWPPPILCFKPMS